MKRQTTVIILALCMGTTSLLAKQPALTKRKMKTEHTVMLEKVVNASPVEIYKRWTSAEGVKSFFAPDARIGAKPGDEYTIMFFPHDDPEGLLYGTRGARILELVPNKKVSFEWIVFAGDALKGAHAPSYAAPAVRNETPIPTWVEMTFKVMPGDKTKIVFRHYGFRDGELWGQSERWFTKQWSKVLDNLAEIIGKDRR